MLPVSATGCILSTPITCCSVDTKIDADLHPRNVDRPSYFECFKPNVGRISKVAATFRLSGLVCQVFISKCHDNAPVLVGSLVGCSRKQLVEPSNSVDAINNALRLIV